MVEKNAAVFSFLSWLKVEGTHTHTHTRTEVLLCPAQGCYSSVPVKEERRFRESL